MLDVTDPSQLKFGLGAAVDEETFKAKYASAGGNVVTIKDLARMRLQARLKAMKGKRVGQGSS